ncbi:WHG domain-containing protein [Actinoplanes sp. NEAU-A12]|uniref:WHG domain-containing protein n=1 Tax=Actinoplanes sandaracinus TaxID=3045177 RepID=A0ABT6WFW6_9ACTN|nr:TetR/AcrR family transcriptional regulator [Actinoplanes sandaracinus]MDI6098623.1 WHG domain-containing protein [Actinoplanes sandaracinus]
MSAANLRARVRAEMTEEIKAVAKRHLATEGANLSLRAVARDLGMASSAVYRYFASRDELLTALIIDAYDAVGDTAEQAAAAAGSPLQKWLAAGHAAREWALANPHEWALIYGSPVPGYAAPKDTVEPATRVLLLLGAIVAEAYRAGTVAEREPLTGRFAEEIVPLAATYYPDLPPRLIADTIAAFFQVCGAISYELFGQLNNGIVEDRRGFFDYQLRAAAKLAGLTG